MYRFFIDASADAVINHHQHCYSGYEEYHGVTTDAVPSVQSVTVTLLK